MFEKYLPPDHKPFARSMREIYPDAHEELAIPFPSVKLLNFPRFNELTGGFRPYEFTILCGSTGTGKTTLVANLSRDLTEQRVHHFVASVETGHTDFVKRKISSFVKQDWNTGEAIAVQKLKDFHTKFGHYFQSDHAWLSLYEDRFRVETLMADIAWMVKHKEIKLAFIDNLNFFLEVTSSRESIVEMDRVIHELIIFCKKIPIHLVMVMHPRKTDGSRVESEFDVKGSSTAVQEAHNVLLWNKPHPILIEKERAVESDREIKIAKMRRKGKYVWRRLIIKSIDGVHYSEGEVI